MKPARKKLRSKMTWGDAALEVLGEPSTWSRFGMLLAGAGSYTLPGWWKEFTGVGLVVFPAIAQVLTEIQRRRGVS